MILLSAPRQVVAVYGVGLIGSAIHRALAATGRWREANYPIQWRDRQRLEGDLDTIFCALRDHTTADVTRISVVWSAGVCGFGSSETDTEPELSVYRRVLESLRSNRES